MAQIDQRFVFLHETEDKLQHWTLTLVYMYRHESKNPSHLFYGSLPHLTRAMILCWSEWKLKAQVSRALCAMTPLSRPPHPLSTTMWSCVLQPEAVEFPTDETVDHTETVLRAFSQGVNNTQHSHSKFGSSLNINARRAEYREEEQS